MLSHRGFKLLERKSRKFAPTEAGELFYKKNLVLVSDYNRMISECERITHKSDAMLTVGYLRGNSGVNLMRKPLTASFLIV